MTTLRIAKELTLPLDGVTQTIGAIGRKGAGKTYLAQLLAEQRLDAGAQVVALDCVGNWWSLRVAADGRGKGKDLFVLGGEHGDVPLTPEAGAKVARFLVAKQVSAVVDVSPFREGERKRFATDFAEEFFHLKKTQRSAVHVIFEEAQKFIPQRPGKDDTRMLGAFENIVRLGRNYGIGATLVTQRPQSVNKEVLSQVECLCVLQVNGTHERKALEAWVQEAGADRQLVGELPGLGQGEGYVWSPSWLRIFQRVHFAAKVTFDASRTPEVGKATKAATLAAVDVDALRADLAEVVQKAEQEDPKALRRRIAELEREAKRRPTTGAKTAAPAAGHADPAHLRTIGRLRAALEEVMKFLVTINASVEGLDQPRLQQAIEAAVTQAGRQVQQNLQASRRQAAELIARLKALLEKEEVQVTVTVQSREAFTVAPSRPSPRSRNGNAPAGDRPPVQQRILDALAELEALGARTPDKELVALLAGYTNLTSKGFANAIGSLVSAALVNYPQAGKIALTLTGRAAGAVGDAPRSTEELQDRLLQVLGGASERILRPLIAAYPNPVDKTVLADAAGYTNLTSKGFANAIGRLRSLGFIDYPDRGFVVARPVLFLEGR